MLDNLSDGRVVVGVGRGLARVEYAGFRLDMNESRQRFNESAELLVQALEEGYAEFDGELINQRPALKSGPTPSARFRAAPTPPPSPRSPASSSPSWAVGILIIPQKPWHDVQTELASYRAAYQEVNASAQGGPGETSANPPAPVVVTFAYCDEDEERAAEMARKYVGGYWESVMNHYEFRQRPPEDHPRLRVLWRIHRQDKHLRRPGRHRLLRQPTGDRNPGAVLSEGDGHLRLHRNRTRWWPPSATAECPTTTPERSMRLFASEVMPELKKFEPTPARG